jgi:hypothetical protein
MLKKKLHVDVLEANQYKKIMELGNKASDYTHIKKLEAVL